MRKVFISVLLFISCKIYSQQNVTLLFQPLFEKSPLTLNDGFYKLNNNDSLQLETLKFYISNVQLLNSDRIVFKEQNSYHLIDCAKSKSAFIKLNVPSLVTYNAIEFNLGIDSVTNVSGAMGGDLDPTKGMYWAWQSGYINFKIEGISNVCTTRNDEFKFHLGGYLFPFSALQKVRLKIHAEAAVEIFINLKKFFTAVDMAKQNHLMSPGADAVSLSALLASCFYTDVK